MPPLSASPTSARALVTRADRDRAAGDATAAQAGYQAAIALDAAFAPAWFGLGALALDHGAAAQAVALIGRAVQLRPRAAWHVALSSALLAEGQAEAARAAAHLAVLKDPAQAAHHHAHALALAALGDRAGALAAWHETARRAPRDPAAQANLAAALYAAGHLDEAAAAIARARALGPATAATLLTEGLVRDAQGDVIEADRVLAQAESLAPGEAAIALGRAGVLIERDRFAPAEARLRGLLAQGPMPQAEFTLAGLLLATGRRREGWAAFEARRALQAPASDLPDWDGGPVDGPVLLEAEQGLGDALHFLRYLSAARTRARIVLRVPPPLRRLAAEAFADLDLGDAAEIPVARAGLPSLPHLLGDPPGDSLIDPVWIRPPEARVAHWRAAFDPLPGRRVGLVWQGNPDYRYDRRRSVPAHLLAPLADIPGLSFVALQPGLDAPDRMHTPRGLDDLADTAAAMAALDLVVSVDTAAAHLAGAAGLPVWLLDRAGGDWRWRPAFGPPLYPSLRRFVQAEPLPPEQAWPSVIDALSAALREWARS